MRKSLGTRILATVLACVLACIGLAACEDISYQQPGNTGAQTSGMTVQVERGDKQLDIKRPSPGAKKPSKIAKDSWTVLVYLCGSDLESNNGAATKDLAEMVNGAASNQINFVVETGGAKRWSARGISNNKIGRYVVQGNSLV